MNVTTDRRAAEEWRALVAAEQEVAKRRAELNLSPSRADLLTQALSENSAWDRSTAFNFLRIFPGDVPKMLDVMVDFILSAGWAKSSSDALVAARGEIDPSRLATVVIDAVAQDDAEAEDYLRLASALAQMEAWGVLGTLIRQAAESHESAIQEIARELDESYGGILPPVTPE